MSIQPTDVQLGLFFFFRFVFSLWFIRTDSVLGLGRFDTTALPICTLGKEQLPHCMQKNLEVPIQKDLAVNALCTSKVLTSAGDPCYTLVTLRGNF